MQEKIYLPECLSITKYESISGEELSPYRRLSAECIKTFVGGYEPYKVLIHKKIPICSIGVEIMPAYYNDYLKKQYPGEYTNPLSAFRQIDQTTDFPEMEMLLHQIKTYRGDGISAGLFYEGKVAEAVSLIVEYQKKIKKNEQHLSIGQVAQTVGYSTSSRFAELFRKSTGILPGEYRKITQQK